MRIRPSFVSPTAEAMGHPGVLASGDWIHIQRTTVKRSRRQSFGPGTLIAVLIVVAGVAMVLPARSTVVVAGPVQLMAPFHSAVSRMVALAFGDTDSTSPAADDSPSANDQRRIVALHQQLAAQQARIQSLEDENAILRGYRALGLTGGRLISARVIGQDSLSWRRSLLVEAGSSRGVQPGQGVISSYHIAAGESVGVRNGMSVLTGESLLGVVVHVSSRAARVRLLGDVESRMAVVTARVSEDGAKILDARFWMTGTQTGLMVIQDVRDEYINDGRISFGDLVLTDGQDEQLPISITIGTIVGMDRQRLNRQLFDLTVAPSVAPESVGRVFVVDRIGEPSS